MFHGRLVILSSDLPVRTELFWMVWVWILIVAIQGIKRRGQLMKLAFFELLSNLPFPDDSGVTKQNFFAHMWRELFPKRQKLFERNHTTDCVALKTGKLAVLVTVSAA
jgi:hypothetical protein